MEVQFLEDNGLFADGEFVADFCPKVVEISLQIKSQG